jgi:hypothetical protein
MRQLLFFLVILFLTSCGKKDVSRNQVISGNVRNNCTGSGFADVTVNFICTQKKSLGKSETSILSTKTNANGDFNFTTDVNTSGKCSYAIDIPGYSNAQTEFYGIRADIEANRFSEFQQFGVSASFSNCFITLPSGIAVLSPDTFTLSFKQPVLHFYEPSRLWTAIYYPRFLNAGSMYSPNFGNYPMGWWQITLDKTKSGVHTVTQDSIYLGMGASATYVIPW